MLGIVYCINSLRRSNDEIAQKNRFFRTLTYKAQQKNRRTNVDLNRNERKRNEQTNKRTKAQSTRTDAGPFSMLLT